MFGLDLKVISYTKILRTRVAFLLANTNAQHFVPIEQFQKKQETHKREKRQLVMRSVVFPDLQ